jgi:hypothetical protein
MANQGDRDTNDLNRDSDEMAGTSGGGRGRTSEGSSGERMGGRSDENIRGIGEGSDEDEFEDAEPMDDEEGDEEEGTI